ncbi:MAG: hypothetical protein H7175_10330 [Burkholderiales bacterium]|nr:hypothetical protein [Anaerolineae bacterium]
MAHAKREVREKARELRHGGMSVREIATTLNVSKGSVSLWVHDIVLSEEQISELKKHQHRYAGQNKGGRSNHTIYMERRKAFQVAGREKARQGSPLHLAGCMLYWAEGAKSRGNLVFVNSDANMMLLFMRFLREELSVTDDLIRMYIHCHNAADVIRIESYWLGLLQLPTTCLRKANVKQGSDTRRNTLSNGVCTIAIHRTEILQHIFGAIQEYGGFENPAWLF